MCHNAMLFVVGNGLKLKSSILYWSLSVTWHLVQILVVHITCWLWHPKMFIYSH